jgi:hypothetical protein
MAIELIETVTLHRGCCRPVPLDLAQLLKGAALDAACDRKTKFTDEERERLYRQGNILSGAVAELIKILTDHPRVRAREFRLATLFEALGATTFIASHVVKNSVLDRLRAASATNENVDRKEGTMRIIAEEMARQGCVGPINKATADELRDTVLERTGQKLEPGTITKYERTPQGKNGLTTVRPKIVADGRTSVRTSA